MKSEYVKDIKRFIIMVIFILFIITSSSSYAYTNNYYKIDIPQKYESLENGMTTVFNRKDGVVIQINVSKNENKVNVLEKKKTFEESSIKNLSEIGYYNIKIENSNKIIINNIECLKLKIKSKIQNIDAYLENYIISTTNYIYGITIISNNELYYSTEEYNNIINSLIIKDKEIKASTNVINQDTENNLFISSTLKGIFITIPFIIIIIIVYKNKHKINSK